MPVFVFCFGRYFKVVKRARYFRYVFLHVRLYQLHSIWTDLRVCWNVTWKSVAKLYWSVKIGQNVGHFTWRRK